MTGLAVEMAPLPSSSLAPDRVATDRPDAQTPIVIDERILHFLMGINYCDARDVTGWPARVVVYFLLALPASA